MELSELPLCLHDIANELKYIYEQICSAWQQTLNGQIDIFCFLLKTSIAHFNLSELTKLYFEHEMHNYELYYNYTYFLSALTDFSNLISSINPVWNVRHEFLFQGIARKSIYLCKMFEQEAERIEAFIEQQSK